jgi:hypothetical protein
MVETNKERDHSTRTLQEQDYKNSGYLRPNQPWVCGWASEGHPCEVGPDGRGKCRATTECSPVMIGDRYVCTRSELQGGKCSDGPLPDGSCCTKIVKCHPERSLRSKRKVVGYFLTAMTVGVFLMFLGGANPGIFVDPGPLTSQHSQVKKDCAGCHTAFKDGPTSWPHMAFAAVSSADDSKLCISCHQFGENSLLAHNIEATELSSISKLAAPASSNSKPWISRLASATLESKGDDPAMFCSTCHQEHHGASFDLKKMSDQRCQSCHTSAFDSLANGHPEFGDYPFKRRTQIQYNHASHRGNYFKEKKYKGIAPTECTMCHIPGKSGSSIGVLGFEKTCAACHLGQIEGEGRATEKGMAVFAVPGLDIETLRDKNIGIGQWPEDPDGGTTPFMDFLLAGNEDFKKAKKVLGDLDFMDLSDATKPQLAAIETYAWAVKELLFDLATEGVPAFGELLEASMGRKISNTELGLLTGLIQADAVLGAQRAWFPKLFLDVTKHRDGKVVPVPPEDEPPTGGSGKDDILTGAPKDDILGVGKQDSILGADNNESILGSEKSGDILSGGKPEDILGGKNQENILGGEDAKDDSAKLAKSEDEEEPDVEIAPGEEWAAAGGWYRDEFTLRYRPSGHVDTMLRSWLDVAGGASSLVAKDSASQILATLTEKGAPGLCIKCHSIDQTSKDKFVINWNGYAPKLNDRPFTKFSHTVHLSLLDDKGCYGCHQLNMDAKYQDSFKNRDPKSFESNFKAIERETCVQCHTQEQAGNDCLICHNYHIGEFAPALTSTPSADSSK